MLLHANSGTQAVNCPAYDERCLQVMRIFKQISNKATSQQGLDALFDMLQQHDQFPIEGILARTSVNFQTYIKKGLKRVCSRCLRPQCLRAIATTSLCACTMVCKMLCSLLCMIASESLVLQFAGHYGSGACCVCLHDLCCR